MLNNFNKIENKFSQIIDKIFTKGSTLPERISVAVSGGIDSMALTFLLQKFCDQRSIELFCVTVDHKFRKDSAKEAKRVGNILTQAGLNHVILESYLANAPQVNIEGSLREVRYNLLIDFCLSHQVGHLFIAHHSCDIAENFLIRLFRGSGIDGLASMDYVTFYQQVNLIRPLLDFRKEELKQYLLAKKIAWVEDESNSHEAILRNKIRKFLSELPDTDVINQRVALASKSILESRKLIEHDMLSNAHHILKFNQLGYFLLFLNNFNNLYLEQAKRYLAWILMEVGGNYYKPRLEKLDNLYQWILTDKVHKARSFYGCIIEKYQDNQLIIYREQAAVKVKQLTVNNIISHLHGTPHAVEKYGFSTDHCPSKDSKWCSLIWDKRFLIKLDNDFVKIDDIVIDNINAVQLNILLKESKILTKFKNIKNPLKKVFYAIPVFKKDNKIIAVPQINYYSNSDYDKKITVQFQYKTPLSKF